MRLSLPGSGRTFSHGVHPPESKEATEREAILRLPLPDELVIPLSQHTGAPAKALVRSGQEVVRGECIAEAAGFVSVPMHAPAAGEISEIGLARDGRGLMSMAITLTPDEDADQEEHEGEPNDVTALDTESLIKAVQAAGIVGLGGAAFPTHVKLSVPEGKTVDTVIVNGCECEPYLTADHRLMLEHPEMVFKGLELAMRAVGAGRGVIGIEDNKPDAIAKMRAALPAGKPFTVESCVTKYPQGAEKMLITALLSREVPSGGLPSDVGVAVFNVATLAQMGELLPMRRGLIERVITVTGPGIERPCNLLVPIGARLRNVLDFCGFRGEEASEVILGGPMMGVSASSLDIPITKGVSGILVMTRESMASAEDKKALPCIRCGSCMASCPMHLNPSQLGLLARKSRYDIMAEQYHLLDCFECGCCSYACPSGIQLVQYFRVAKSVVRQRRSQAASQAK